MVKEESGGLKLQDTVTLMDGIGKLASLFPQSTIKALLWTARTILRRLMKKQFSKKEISDFCKKATKNYIQAITLNLVVLISLFSIPGYVLFHHTTKDWIVPLIIIYVFTIIAAEFFNEFIWAKLFPVVSFSWGESIEYYRKIEKWKNGVFWSVIIAIPVAILANYLFDLLKGS